MKAEQRWGYDMVTSAYKEKPEESERKIYEYMKEIYPIAEDKDIKKVVGVEACRKK